MGKELHKEVKKYAIEKEILVKDATDHLIKKALEAEGWMETQDD